jgi:hypothetical protein
VPVKAPHSHRFDYLIAMFFFLCRQHSENLNEKLKLAGALNGAPRREKGTAAVLRQ